MTAETVDGPELERLLAGAPADLGGQLREEGPTPKGASAALPAPATPRSAPAVAGDGHRERPPGA